MMPVRTLLVAASIMTVLGGAPARPAAADSPGPMVIDGYLSMRAVLRSALTDSHEKFKDQDLSAELRIDMTSGPAGRYEFHFLGASRYDIDGDSDIRTFHPLEDTGNARTSDVKALLYEAHLDINHLLTALPQVRLGRQAGTRDEQLFFDGAAVDIRPGRSVFLTLYGGLPVNLFEVDGKESNDAAAGAGLDLALGASTGISFDYLAVQDDRTYFDDRDVTSRLTALKAWQRLGRHVKASARMRHQNGERRDLNVRLLGAFPEQGAELGATYVRQFRDQTETTNTASQLFDVLGTSHPYHSIDIRAKKLFGERYAVDLGYFQRALLNTSETGTFNREYSRTSAGFEVAGLLFSNLTLLVTGERWRSEDQGFSTAGADLSYGFGPKAKAGKVSVGTYYSLYKFDQNSALGERERVRTYYVNTRASVAARLSLTAGYEWEQSIEQYQTGRVGVRYDF